MIHAKVPRTEPSGYRSFETGATRDHDTDKLDYDGFLSPLALERYAKYMHGHRKLPDGTMRESDNWQLGIAVAVYMKSKWRHFFDTWKSVRGYPAEDDLETSLCAELFNTMGMLHEVLQEKRRGKTAAERNLSAYMRNNPGEIGN